MRSTVCAALLLCVLTPAGLAAPGHEKVDATPEEARPAGLSWAERFRQRLLKDEENAGQFGLVVGETVGELRDKPVVVYIHGFNSTIESAGHLVRPLLDDGYCCIGFGYPNDQRISESARLLSEDLRAFASAYPSAKISLVTHSMGGLVARACIENPKLFPASVVQLVMVAPPTHGSELARAATATDLWEHWIARKSGSPWRRTRDAILDGLGEAAIDLVPGSPFLIDLNKQPRNPSVRYSLVIGDGGFVKEEQLEWLREATVLAQMSDATQRVDQMAAQMEELIEGRGDGVVSVTRAQLDGVDDVTILRFTHLDVTTCEQCEGADLVRATVLAKVKSLNDFAGAELSPKSMSR